MAMQAVTRTATIAAALLALAAPVLGASGSAWHYGYNMGIGEYGTGEWDSATGGALILSCENDGRVVVSTQIKGQAPPGGSLLRLTTSSREGSAESRFTTDARGSVSFAAAAPEFADLWRAMRMRDILTVRYADDRFVVLSLDGAKATLPPKPCG